VNTDTKREKMSEDKLQQLYDNYLEFTDHMVGVHGAMQVAAVMMTQSLSIYRSAMDPEDYDRMVDSISASRSQVKTFNRLPIQ
jgi:hypothetical protein